MSSVVSPKTHTALGPAEIPGGEALLAATKPHHWLD